MGEKLESEACKIFQWLKSDNMIFKGQCDSDYTFIKYPYSKKLDIIYGTQLYNVGIDGNLNYSGIYDKEKEKLIVIDYYLNAALGFNLGDILYKNYHELEEELKNKLKMYVENYVSQYQDEFYAAAKNYNGYCNNNRVEHDFVNGCENYEYEADIYELSYKNIVKCLDDENYLLDMATDYIQKHKENIGRQLKDNDEKNKYLTSLINNKNHDLYKAKEISDILKNSAAQKVQIYIRKEGINFDFKYNKEILKNSLSNSYISLYGMLASDRRKFRELFGNNSDFNYKNIYKIEYRSKPIYADRDYDNIPEKDEYSL